MPPGPQSPLAGPNRSSTVRLGAWTYLQAEFPIFSDTSWMGHSAALALKHFALLRDEDFLQTAGRAVQKLVHACCN